MALKWMKTRQMNCVSHREGKGREGKGREGKGREGIIFCNKSVFIP